MKGLKLRSGEDVIIPPESHFHDHLSEFGDGCFEEALNRIHSENRQFIEEEIVFSSRVGFTNCVETTSADVIVYAQRPGRKGLTRFVRERRVTSCSKLVVVLKQIEEGYRLVTAFVGYKVKEPWDSRATEQDKLFWTNHALVWGSQEVVPGTETTVCPW